ncbi:MAG TPA: flagellar basal body P-ring protein FlgI, partial [Humisphaera sp.]
MNRRISPRRPFQCLAAAALAVTAGAFVAAGAGCTQKVAATSPLTPAMGEIPGDSNVQQVFRGTIRDHTLLVNDVPHNVSGFGLVGQLRGTGDCTASPAVLKYMTKEMVRRGFGDATLPGYKDVTHHAVLQDPNYAVVRVDAWIPPGARKDDFCDAYVSCFEGNNTKSLVHGVLFEADLRTGGADVDNPATLIHTHARAKGPIVVNPAYALAVPEQAPAQARASLRTGTVMFNTRVMQDRPLSLRLRKPQWSMSRHIEAVVKNHFRMTQDDAPVAKAINEGIVELYVPRSFKGDWERFARVVQNLYMETSPEFDVAKAAELAKKAAEPNAPLEEISYAMEALGDRALPSLRPLMAHPDPRVSYWAARAAAYVGDETMVAQARLAQVAATTNHPYRLAAVRALGGLPNANSVNHLLRPLLDANETLVRIEAYRMMAKNRAFPDMVVSPTGDPENQKFYLDVVPGKAPPLIYVSRTGKPRIAILGAVPEVRLDDATVVMDNRLTIAATPGRPTIATLHFRDPTQRMPVRALSRPGLDVLIARMAGMGPEGEASMNFTYGEIVAVVQALVDGGKLKARNVMGDALATSMVIQDPP